MSAPAVSVVVVVWNAAWCIERALDSVMAQTLPAERVEVIVADDGSTDGTPDLVERRYGGRVRVLRLPHRNASATRAVGLLEARGEWLAFLDADDWWEPVRLERQLDYAAAHPEVRWLSSDGVFVSAEGVIRESWLADYFDPVVERRGDLFAPLLQRCFPLMSSMLVARDAYHAAGGLDPAMVYSHDYDLWLRLAARFPGALLPERLIHYWSHPGSLSRRFEGRHRDNLLLMERVARGDLRPEPALRRAGRERAAGLAFDVGLLCLHDGRAAEAKRFFRRATGAGPGARRAFAAAACVTPAAWLPAVTRLRWLKGPVAQSRSTPGTLPGPGGTP